MDTNADTTKKSGAEDSLARRESLVRLREDSVTQREYILQREQEFAKRREAAREHEVWLKQLKEEKAEATALLKRTSNTLDLINWSLVVICAWTILHGYRSK